jgi:hypothetical protein
MKFLNFFPLFGGTILTCLDPDPESQSGLETRKYCSHKFISEPCPGCQVPRSLAGCAQDRARLPPDHAARARHL